MPRILASSNAEQRALTKHKVLDAFGELLFSHGLPGLTMTDVARRAGVGRTAIYNYFADLEQLLVAYALNETGKFLADLKHELSLTDNAVDQLAVYVRAQLRDLSKRHLPPGPALRSVLSSESFAKLAIHVTELSDVLEKILRDGIAQGYLPAGNVSDMANLIHGSLSSVSRASATDGSEDQAATERIENAVRFIQAGVGAQTDEQGTPVRILARIA